MTEFINPLDIVIQRKAQKAAELATASAGAQTEGQQEMATASALTNVDPSICPKCGRKMGFGFLFDKTQVYYCDTDRVSQPME
uniref:DNA ligase n=1 Tax=Pseudomonas phage HRDY3 TaxID=3236930 RepID=A0AB39CDG7_9VIRU